MRNLSLLPLLLCAPLGISACHASDPPTKTAVSCTKMGANTGVAGAKTGVTTGVEGVKTFGKAVGGFVEGGSEEAKKKWQEGKAETKRTAHEGADETKRESTLDCP
jgi:hypothetical protein